MKLLRALILRPLRQDPLRTALTILAVALGVGVVIAIELAGDAAGGSFQSSLQTVVGKVDLEIIANGGLDESIIGKLTALPINANFCPILQSGTTLGLDPFACATAFRLSSERSEGMSVVDIAQAQQTLHEYGHLDQIAVFLDPNQDFPQAEHQIQSALPEGYLLQKPGTRSEENRRMLRAFRWNLRVLSYISLVVGAFLIYNTISISVVRRRTEIGILRALGTSRSTIFLLFLAEAILLGLAGATLGLAFGRIMAAGHGRPDLPNRQSALYTSSRPGAIELSWIAILQSLAAGTLLAIFSAARPRPRSHASDARRSHGPRIPRTSKRVCMPPAICPHCRIPGRPRAHRLSRRAHRRQAQSGGYIATCSPSESPASSRPSWCSPSCARLRGIARRAFRAAGLIAGRSLIASLARTSIVVGSPRHRHRHDGQRRHHGRQFP